MLGCRGSEGNGYTQYIANYYVANFSVHNYIGTYHSDDVNIGLVTDHSSSTINPSATVTTSMTATTTSSATPTSETTTGSSSGIEMPQLAIYIGAGVGGLMILIITGVYLLCIYNKKDLSFCTQRM